VLRAAREDPDVCVVGLDADMSRMREASRRAARPVSKGGTPNAWFAVATAERPPGVLQGRVDALRVTLPWGSLLRGVLEPGTWFDGVASRLLRPGGELRLLVSVTVRDRLPGMPLLDVTRTSDLALRYAATGWRVVEARPATSRDVERCGSSWAKRLGIPGRRPAALLSLERTQSSSDAA
jgi:hypothetical protein